MMQMARKDWEAVLDQADIAEENVRLDYSGRAMYGRTCPGLTGDISLFGQFMAALGYLNHMAEEEDRDELADPRQLAGMTRTDSMGYDTIYYFPELELTDD